MSNINQVFESVQKLTVAEMIELVKKLEQEWGVSAAPVAVSAGVSASSSAAEEQTSFTVTLAGVPDATKKINVIKELRSVISGLGLAEAKAIVDGAPKVIKENVKREDAEEIKSKLESAGAKVEVK